MQANLVFSPFAKPRPPLGIAMLKSYVEKNSDFSVKCFDFSLAYRYDLADAVRDNKVHFNFPQNGREKFLQTIDFFKNKNNEDFFNQALYNEHASVWVAYFDRIKGNVHEAIRRALQENKPTPWFGYDYAKQLLANKPDVVGFSLMFPEQFYPSALISRILKELNKNIKIVFGGYVSSTAYKELLTNSFIDFIALGEGEKSLLGLMKALNREQKLQQVPNLAYRENGKIVKTEPEMITNLDELPFPDFSDFDLNSYFSPAPLVSTFSSRGCYWRRCAFCVHHKNYFSKYRTVSVTRVVDQLEYYLNNGIKYFSFIDEMISAKRFRQIGEEITRRKLELYYYALAKPTADFTKEVFEIMYKSGCRYIIWGLESGCQRILDLIDKGTKVEDISKTLTYSASAGIKNHVFIIIGFPSETKEELGKTLNFLYENKDSIHTIHKGAFSLHKGSLVHQHPEKFYITRVYDSRSSMRPSNYDVSQGLKHNELKRYKSYYAENYFHYFNYFSPFSTVLRGDALFHYSNNEKLRFNEKRKPVPLPEEVGLPPQPVAK